MPGPWNDATECQLLLTIIHLTAPQLPKWDKVAALMGGLPFTADSTRQHFQKLRKDCRAKLGDPTSAVGTSTNKTPNKSATKTKETSTKHNKKRKAKQKSNDSDDEGESPIKKQAIEGESEEPAFL